MTFVYKHQVQYYETDKMGITHHSNYIRWMEEARTFLLDEIGCPYHQFEEEGLISPVMSLSCDYKATTTFPDLISITVSVKAVKSAKLIFNYRMVNEKGDLVFNGSSEHSFLTKDGKFVHIKRDYPKFYESLNNCIEDIRKD